MDRYLQNTPATLSVTYYEAGVAVDPGVVTIGVTRADGTTLVAAGTATTGTGANARTFTLTGAQVATLDTLTASWVSATKGTLATKAEIVGGFLFSTADARNDPTLTNTTTYTSTEIAEARTLAEESLEHACGVAFVPRYTIETVSGDASTDLVLRWPKVRSFRKVTVDDVDLTSTELADVTATNIGAYWETKWVYGVRNVRFGYEHGHDYPPPRVSRACLLLAKHYLVGAQNERATSISTEEGTFSMVTAGVRGAPFSIPEVNQVVAEYGYAVSVA